MLMLTDTILIRTDNRARLTDVNEQRTKKRGRGNREF